MIWWLRVFVLIASAISLTGAIKAYRLGRDVPLTAWGVRATLVSSIGLIAFMAPQVFAPSIAWLRWTGLLVSSALLIVSFVLLRRQQVALKAATQRLNKVP